MGEKIIIFASRPGLIVGRKGENIKKLTENIKSKFKLENPQIEIAEVEDINLDARIVAERIASTLERYGSSKFKAVGHKTISDAISSGALGIEILISGKIPGARAKRWRFYKGYLKKCGDVAIEGVREAITFAQLKSGVIGIQVKIMPPSVKLPDNILLKKDIEEEVEEVEAKDEEIEEDVDVSKEKKSDDDKKEKEKKKESKGSEKKESKDEKVEEKKDSKESKGKEE
jgi:small subunit ribosomal protein S3